ncbi:glycerophosphodiester phosphodiesterase [Bacteroides sp. 214]|uniref:glycerophosphodiester phosphodiesterase family protein n=1 Tax=Bacteroides sp. 214 TaxID=2302935 RepID=UPI0013D62330|nr:glycerophosphodiester phosphodiesterase family protein [Bacteroides sp. 214]NDW11555.1 glycerophosphodiester phosphodiesterase [Bacteroides sp. 214]
MKKILVLLLLSVFVDKVCTQTQVIAHRGFWKTEGATQNCIAAMQKADSAKCYGSELDVWLSKDNVLFVNHDPFYKGVSMENDKSSAIKKLKLANGEKLPTLKEYLSEARKLNVRLIIELKKHSSAKRETRAVEEIIGLIKKYNLEERVEYISFSLHATKEFIRLASPSTPVYYLNGNLSPKELKEIGCTGPDYNLSVLKKNPGWIKESHELGMKVNVWTVNKEADMRWAIDQGIDFITTDEPLLLHRILKGGN